MTTSADLVKAMLAFGHDSPGDREFTIRENREDGELVAIVGPTQEELGRVMAAGPAMKLALEAVADWYRNGGPGKSDPPMDLVQTALDLTKQPVCQAGGQGGV
jgi:hypothetical protein